MNKCTYIDGIASSVAIDTSGEIVDLKGLDISSLVGGPSNWEHNKDLPSQIVGKIVEAHKIFSEDDCLNERHKHFWNKFKIAFLYCKVRLFDDKKNPKPSSIEVAALFRDDAEHPHEQPIVGFSIEGAKLNKTGSVVTHSIARKLTITVIPCNKTCIAELIPTIKNDKKDDISSLFKGEMELFKFEPTYEDILEKASDAGSSLGGAPSSLVQGAALATEDVDKKIKKMHKKERSKHFERADQAYKSWSDREKFKGYMKKRMPHLADGEIDAFGRVLALKKDMDKESKLSKMYSSYFGKGETGHETGIHTQSPSQKPGVSAMGQQVRRAKAFSDKAKYPAQYTSQKANFTAKMHSESKSKQAAAIPTPHLKSEDVEKTTDIMMASEDKNKKK